MSDVKASIQKSLAALGLDPNVNEKLCLNGEELVFRATVTLLKKLKRQPMKTEVAQEAGLTEKHVKTLVDRLIAKRRFLSRDPKEFVPNPDELV